MKKLSLFLLLLVFLSINLHSQSPLVITKSNFNVEVKNDTIGLIYTPVAELGMPTFGANQNWDYSNLNTIGQGYGVNYNEIPTEPFFSNANFVFPDYFEVIAGERGYYYDEYHSLNDNGYQAIGFGVREQAYFIGDLTGSPTDSIVFHYQNQMYNNPRSILKFPFTYNDVVVSEFRKSLDFTLSVTPFGLNNASAQKVTHTVQVDTVVGWGKLKVPNIKNGINSSIPYDVLLVKRTTVSVDSLYLYGMPAPEALLAAFSLEQGTATVSQRLLFWRANSKSLLMTMNLDNSGNLTGETTYDLNTDISTSVEISDDANSNMIVYPNPVQKYLNVKLNENLSANLNLSITDIFGTTITNKQLTSNDLFLELPSQISNGTYFIKLSDEFGNIKSKGKFIVNN
jgi:hypothetical protein